jgi:hypothetical protein
MQQPLSTIAELEEAVTSGSAAKRVSTQRRVTDLFLRDERTQHFWQLHNKIEK